MVKIKYPLKDLLKTRHANEPMSNIFSDRADNIIAWFLANFTKVTPNQVTTAGFICGIISAVLFLKGELFLGALFFIIRHFSDGVDGRLSRLTGQQSKFGAWYENYVGVNLSFLNIMGLCIGQYLISNKIIWLIFMPLLMQSFRMHNWASMKMAMMLGDKFKETVVKSKEGKEMNLIDKIKKLLVKLGTVEPFNSADGSALLFIVNPLIGPVLGITMYIITFWLVVIACKEIFWFFYYRNILKKIDAEEKDKIKK